MTEMTDGISFKRPATPRGLTPRSPLTPARTTHAAETKAPTTGIEIASACTCAVVLFALRILTITIALVDLFGGRQHIPLDVILLVLGW